ncbi:anticodon-binding domain-containing protein [Chytriomyces sp. MP71]|nr:anticodon-binding domain-containing protein [Chytriomyces sp. MP71]
MAATTGASSGGNANTANANAAVERLIGAHVRVVLTTEAEYSGLVFAYERNLGLLVLQARVLGDDTSSSIPPKAHNFHFLKVSAIKTVARVNSAASSSPSPSPTTATTAPAPAQTSVQPSTAATTPKLSAWGAKPGAPTAAQIVAGTASKPSSNATSPVNSAPASTSVSQQQQTPVPSPPLSLVAINTAAPINLQKIQHRRQAAIAAERESVKKIGVNVSKHAQDIFNALDKTMPTRWKGDAIIVLDEVMIMAPYRIDDVRGITPTSGSAVDRVQKVLEQVLIKLKV